MAKKQQTSQETIEPEVQEESSMKKNKAEKGKTSPETTKSNEAVAQAEQETETKEEKAEETKELTEEEKLRARVKELEDKLLRTAADFDNYKKRMARQFEEVIRSANDKLLGELLEVVDNFERALAHHNNEEGDLEALRKGTELIFNQMKELLQKYNITPIEALGKPFDPAVHEALMQVESEEYPEGVVAVEMSKGYKMGDRVLRHSKVGVSKGKPSAEQSSES